MSHLLLIVGQGFARTPGAVKDGKARSSKRSGVPLGRRAFPAKAVERSDWCDRPKRGSRHRSPSTCGTTIQANDAQATAFSDWGGTSRSVRSLSSMGIKDLINRLPGPCGTPGAAILD